MKYLVPLFLLLIPVLSIAQNLIGAVIDTDSIVVPGVSILRNNEYFTLSNKSGQFQTQGIDSDDIITFIKPPFIEKSILFSELKYNNGVVILKNHIDLAPVIVKGQYKRVNVSIRQKKRTNSRLISNVGSEYALKIENSSHQKGKINAVILYLHKTKKDVNISPLEINFYKIDSLTGQPSNKINKDQIVFFPKAKNRGKFKLNVEDFNIVFPKDGVVVGIKYLPNEFGDKKVGPSLRLTLSEEPFTFKRVKNGWGTFGVYPGDYKTVSNIMVGLDIWVRK